ncbi:MAG TPA: CHAT domain-containing protein [Pyrinomonadaceae bacterium]|jgi:CHAT domain-containing protein/tetratricopeptide (TPR) repeat protein|nr:CHAT domain-containing protein [Pyrinomonadaceae bacterium]
MKRILLPAFLFVLTASFTVQSQTQTQPNGVTLEQGKVVARDISGGDTHQYNLTVPAGGYAHVDVDQIGINIAVSVFAEGQRVRQVDNSAGGNPELFALVAENATTYRLEVAAPDKYAGTAKYTIVLKETRPATATDKATVEGQRRFEDGFQLVYQQTKEARTGAVAKFQESIPFWQEAKDKASEARSYYMMAYTYIQLGEYAKAEETATNALPIAKASGDKSVEAYLFDTIGLSYNERGLRKKALEFFEQALPLRTATDRVGRASTINNIGIAYAWLSEQRKALEYLTEAARILGELGDRKQQASIFSTLCVVHSDLSEFNTALEFGNRAFQMKRELNDQAGQAIALNNVGSAYAGMGEYEKALEAWIQVNAIHQKLGQLAGQGIALNNIGWVYAMIGDYDKALDFYYQALVPFQKLRDVYGEATTLSNIGVNYADKKDYAKALEIHQKVLAIRVDDTLGRAITLNNIGGCYQNLGDKAKALEFYTQAVALHRKLGNKRHQATSIRNLGTFYRDNGEYAKAIELFIESREISRGINDFMGEASSLAHWAKLERERGNLLEAHKLVGEAIATTESVRLTLKSQAARAFFLAASRKYYELDIDVLMRLHKQHPDEGYAAAALQVSEKGRARSLMDLLREARAEIRQGVDTALIDREGELRKAIAESAERQTRLLSGKPTEEQATTAAREIEMLTVEFDQVQAQIRETSPRYAALTQPAPLNLAEIQKQVLDDDTLLLEYALGDEKGYLWAVTPDSIRSYELPARATIEKVARRFYELATERSKTVPDETMAQRQKRLADADAEYPQAGAELSKLLLAPVAAELKQKRLVIVGEGVLQYVPFAALPSPATDNSPLIVRHEIVSLPSASVLAVLRNETVNRKPASKTVAVLADPVFSANDPRLKTHSAHADDTAVADAQRSAAESGVGSLTRLHFSRQEAEDIARLAGEKRNFQALDFAASRTVATNDKLGDYRIVHFATHGLINNHHPDLSGIVLSLVDEQGRPQNGFLRLYDIYNLKLNADLVVLSACQTALGKDIKGEGLVGLTRGFMYAGAPRVVASYWRIDDRATADIMKRFYSAMLKDGLRPAAALRAAQISMLQDKRWQSPHYWAAFTIQGEWK